MRLFTVERRELGNGEVFFEVRGVKRALGHADQLRQRRGRATWLTAWPSWAWRTSCAARVLNLGDEVRIGRGARMVEFDWDPTISAGAEMLDGSNLGARG